MEALDDFELALLFNPPKDQSLLLTKKISECQKRLSNICSTNATTEKENKHRTHDTEALAF